MARKLSEWWQSRRWWFIAAIVFGLAMIVAAWLGQTLWAAGLFLAASFSAFIALPRGLWRYIRENDLFLGASATVFMAALAVLGIWVWTSVQTTIASNQRLIWPIPRSGAGPWIEIDAPGFILADGASVTMTVSLRPGGIEPDKTVTVTLDLPQAIVPDPDIARHPITKTLALDSRDSEGLLIRSRRVLTETVTQDLVVTVATTFTVPFTDTLPLKIEGERNFAWRTFINSTVSERSPAVLLATILFALASGLIAQYVKRDELRENEAREKGQGLIAQFRARLKAGDLVHAREAFDQLDTAGVREYAQEALPVMKALLLLGDGTAASGAAIRAAVQAGRVWPDETAAALATGYERLLKADPVAVREARLLLFQNPLPLDIRQKLEGQQESETQLQPFSRPSPQVAFPSPDAPIETNQFLESALQGINPFPRLRAEQEVGRLFGKTLAFWPGHPLHERLAQPATGAVVHGQPGSGRTALALELGRHLSKIDQKRQLALYATDGDDLAEIQAGFARLLLRFVLAHPTHLIRLDGAERRLLAEVLGVGLGVGYVQAELASAERDINATIRLLQAATHGAPGQAKYPAAWLADAQSEAQRGLWAGASLGALTQLADELAQVTVEPKSPQALWPRGPTRCARSLEFEGVRLVLDIGEPDQIGRVDANLLPHLPVWVTDGLSVLVFVPSASLNRLHPRPDVPVVALGWRPEQLRAMVARRFAALSPSNIFLGNVLDDEALHLMIETSCVPSKGAPRRFSSLWTTITERLPAGKAHIEPDDVRQVLNSDWAQ